MRHCDVLYKEIEIQNLHHHYPHAFQTGGSIHGTCTCLYNPFLLHCLLTYAVGNICLQLVTEPWKSCQYFRSESTLSIYVHLFKFLSFQWHISPHLIDILVMNLYPLILMQVIGLYNAFPNPRRFSMHIPSLNHQILQLNIYY